MKINHIAQTYGTELQKAAGNLKPRPKGEKTSKSDQVSVSKEGSALNKSSASAEVTSQRVNSLPEIRWDKVEAAKKRISEGFYNTAQFRDELADKLIKDFDIGIS